MKEALDTVITMAGDDAKTKGDAIAACENYKKVTAGNNVAAAKYQIETVLKCQ